MRCRMKSWGSLSATYNFVASLGYVCLSVCTPFLSLSLTNYSLLIENHELDFGVKTWMIQEVVEKLPVTFYLIHFLLQKGLRPLLSEPAPTSKPGYLERGARLRKCQIKKKTWDRNTREIQEACQSIPHNHKFISQPDILITGIKQIIEQHNQLTTSLHYPCEKKGSSLITYPASSKQF